MLAALISIVIFMGGDRIFDFSPLILIISAVFSLLLTLIAGKLSKKRLKEGLRKSAGQILPAVPLLIFIAMISATWMMSGVVPAMIDYGVRYLNPTTFLATACIICAIVSVMTGSSWTTIATIGVAFIGIGKIMGYNECWIAGAIISGAYFGDKVSPLSDTTVVASSSCKVDLFDHIRYLMFTTVPAMSIALIVFLCVGFATTATAVDTSATPMIAELRSTFNISPWVMVIPLIVVTLIALKIKTLYTLAIGTALGIAGIFIFQPGILATIEGDGLHTLSDHLTAVASLLWNETSVPATNPDLSSLLTTGGILGMTPTIILVLSAMLFGAAMIGTGMLAVIAVSFTRHLKKRTSIVGATVGSGLFLNACTADQYLSIIIGANMYRDVYRQYNFEPRLLSRTIEDSVSVTSVLIPWNSCGITQSTVLGVATLAYLPCCIFNILSPLMTLLLAWTGFKIKNIRQEEAPEFAR